jgi:hypothetical protein
MGSRQFFWSLVSKPGASLAVVDSVFTLSWVRELRGYAGTPCCRTFSFKYSLGDKSRGALLRSITDQNLLRRDESGRRVQFRPTKAQIGYLSPALQPLQRVWTPSHRLIGL